MAKAPKQIEFKRRRGRHLVRIGPREFETRGLADSFWTDLYHRSMIVSWPTFFGTAAAIFVIFNAVFAFLAVANGFAGRELVRMGQRRFTPPWSAEITPNSFIVRHADG